MSIAKIEKYIDDIDRKITKSIKLLGKGDKLNYGDGLKLGRKSNSIISTIKKAIKEYDGTQPTEAETQRILTKVEKLTKIGEEQVVVLIANKPRFDQLKVGGLIKLNLKKLQEVSGELDKIVETKAPANLKPQAEDLSKRRGAAIQKAVDAFAGATGGEAEADNQGEDDSD